MIHQFTLAAPKPGMTADEFQDHWVHIHAVKFVSKISQISRYLVDTRIAFDGDDTRMAFDSDLAEPRLPHQGIAETWLAGEDERVAALQSDEYLQGVRPDEANWAATWLTLTLDTTEHEMMAGPALRDREPSWVKLTTLIKRRPGTSLEEFRRDSLESYAAAVDGLPGLRRHLHCHALDWEYVFGEARFDGIEQLWFDDIDALRAALRSTHYAEQVKPALDQIADPQYVFSLTTREHWIVGPTPR